MISQPPAFVTACLAHHPARTCVVCGPPSRPSWDDYFLGLARAAAARSDCTRSQVGAVVVNNRRVRSTGYNGSPAGEPGCETCPRRLSGVAPCSPYNAGPGACVAVHAEANALLYADRVDLIGAELYITRAPCDDCTKLIRAAGVVRVVWPDGEINYRKGAA